MSDRQTAGVDLFWPGSHRSAGLLSDQAFLDALVRVESAWVGRDLPPVALADLDAGEVEAGGNPVIPLVRLLRERTGDAGIHRGLTSQDVVDTALMLLARDAVDEITTHLRDARPTRWSGWRANTPPPRWPAAPSPSTPCPPRSVSRPPPGCAASSTPGTSSTS